MKLVIFGPQGSGKGTQAEFLSKKLKVPQISMGELLRDEIEAGTKYGRRIAAKINKGNCVSNQLALLILQQRLKKADCRPGYILDGFPRNLPQAKILDKFEKINQVLEIYISDAEALKRIAGRLTCPKCGAVYHVKHHPPKKMNRCDKCGGTLMMRDDDKPAYLKKRLANYHLLTEPLKKYYLKQGKLITIDGTPSIAMVTKEIVKKLRL